MAGRCFIISGISGSGKSTISDILLKDNPEISRAITVTSREPREGEIFSYHYYFINPSLFKWLNETGQLLEYTIVYGDTFYGTLKLSVDRIFEQNKDVLFVVDNRGVEQITEKIPNAISLFLAAPSDAEQRSRLEARGTVGEDLEIRVSKAKEELEWAKMRGLPIVINDTLEEAVKEVKSIFNI
jgi:guanylate kinase